MKNSSPTRARIYLDNSATSHPKPAEVYQAMMRFATEVDASAGRGGYAEAREAGRLMHGCRERINRLINGASPDHVVFTLNGTDALNIAIKGLINPGTRDHAITTWMAHNSVLRPLNALAERGDTEQTRIPCDPKTGLVDPDDIARAITPHTRLVAVVHGSNVSGTLMPIAEIGAICRERGVPFLVDAAQTAGHVPIDVRAMNIDLLAMPGHKGLLGPLGTGVLYIRPGLEERLRTLREGGTGSLSESDVQPLTMPDKFEAGSHNAIGLAGLAAGVQWILERGVEHIWEHEEELINRMLQRLDEDDMPGLRLIGPPDFQNRCGVFSIVIEGVEPNELSAILEDEYSLLTRAGFHCAPLAHRTLGTDRLGGTTRISFGAFNSEAEVDVLCDAFREICREYAATTSPS